MDSKNHFDRALFLQNIGGDEAMLQDFLKDVPGQFEAMFHALNEAFLSGDSSLIKKAAHSLKGASMNMQFSRLSQLAKALEEAVMENNPDLEKKLHQQILKEWSDVQPLLT